MVRTATAVTTTRRRRSTPRWICAFTYFLMQYKRTWRSSLASNFVYPALYLTAMGVGLGHLVNQHVGTQPATLGGLSYLSYIAPGILASSSMQIAMQESTYPILGAIRWNYAYPSMLATPIRVIDVLRAHLGFAAFRLFLTCASFILIAWGFGAVHSPEAVLAVPIGMLCGLAFAAPIAAFSIRQEYDTAFPLLNRLIIIPLFLFSGTFFPIHQLPGGLQVLAEALPLFHGVSLARACTTGHVLVWTSFGHLGYLLVLATAGYLAARRSYERRLAS